MINLHPFGFGRPLLQVLFCNKYILSRIKHLSEVDNDATALCLYPVWREVWRKALLGALRHRQTAVEERLLVLVLQVRDKLLHCTLKGLGHQMNNIFEAL